jgi:hypothetical protein
VRKLVPLIAIGAVVVGFAAVIWAFEYRQRATQAQVWSARCGDDPACRQVFVSVIAGLDISHETVRCEGG